MRDLLFDYVCDWLIYYDILDLDMFIHSSSLAVQPWVGVVLPTPPGFIIFFLRGGVGSLMPNPQPGGSGYPLLSGSSPLTCLAWEALPVAYATGSIALFRDHTDMFFM